MILVRDAVCRSSDEGHDALAKLYHERYTEWVEVADARTNPQKCLLYSTRSMRCRPMIEIATAITRPRAAWS
jgi:hypothetical protein